MGYIHYTLGLSHVPLHCAGQPCPLFEQALIYRAPFAPCDIRRSLTPVAVCTRVVAMATAFFAFVISLYLHLGRRLDDGTTAAFYFRIGDRGSSR